MEMDAETLERLLMDRALGTLPADADTLLEAYLTHDAAAAERAREFAAAAAAARQVLHAGEAAPLPPFPVTRALKLEQVRQRIRWLRNTSGIAATLVMGIGLGAWLAQPPAARPAGPDRPQSVLVAHPAKSAGEDSHGTGFWSVSRLARRIRGPRPVPAAPLLIWDSPVTQPRLGGSS